MKTRLIDGVEVHRGSGNVFSDLGLAGAEKLKIEIKVRPATAEIGHLMLATAYW